MRCRRAKFILSRYSCTKRARGRCGGPFYWLLDSTLKFHSTKGIRSDAGSAITADDKQIRHLFRSGPSEPSRRQWTSSLSSGHNPPSVVLMARCLGQSTLSTRFQYSLLKGVSTVMSTRDRFRLDSSGLLFERNFGILCRLCCDNQLLPGGILVFVFRWPSITCETTDKGKLARDVASLFRSGRWTPGQALGCSPIGRVCG
jgi:hypothetical protein